MNDTTHSTDIQASSVSSAHAAMAVCFGCSEEGTGLRKVLQAKYVWVPIHPAWRMIAGFCVWITALNNRTPESPPLSTI